MKKFGWDYEKQIGKIFRYLDNTGKYCLKITLIITTYPI